MFGKKHNKPIKKALKGLKGYKGEADTSLGMMKGKGICDECGKKINTNPFCWHCAQNM